MVTFRITHIYLLWVPLVSLHRHWLCVHLVTWQRCCGLITQIFNLGTSGNLTHTFSLATSSHRTHILTLITPCHLVLILTMFPPCSSYNAILVIFDRYNRGKLLSPYVQILRYPISLITDTDYLTFDHHSQILNMVTSGHCIILLCSIYTFILFGLLWKLYT